MVDIFQGNFLFNISLSLVITLAAYSGIPIAIVMLFKRFNKPIALELLKTIIIINSILFFVVFSIIRFEITGRSTASGAILIWPFITYRYLKQKYATPKTKHYYFDTLEESSVETEEKLSHIENSSRESRVMDNKETNLMDTSETLPEDDLPSEVEDYVEAPVSLSLTEKEKKRRYCKYCGTLLEHGTIKCTSCGKRVRLFPAVSSFKMCVGLLIVFIITTAILSVRCVQLSSQVETLRTIKNRLIDDYKSLTAENKELEAAYKNQAGYESYNLSEKAKAVLEMRGYKK